MAVRLNAQTGPKVHAELSLSWRSDPVRCIFDTMMCMTIIDILQEKRDDVLEVTQRHGVTSVRIFGSVARGDEPVESDIDFLITTGPRS